MAAERPTANMLRIRAVSHPSEVRRTAELRARVQLPLELQKLEDRYVWQRRGRAVDPKQDPELPPDRVGLAFSGGGIRSATLSLGILQALARKQMLRHVDYLSTVSGGGYIGVFLGGLFARWTDQQPGVSQSRIADWERVEGVLCDPRQHPIAWLRENGRYLAPNGAGDLTLALAIVVRNLLAVHIVLGTLALAAAMSLIGIRLVAGLLVQIAADNRILPLAGPMQQIGHSLHAPWLWWSPTVLVAGAAFGLLVVPVGIAYWLVRSAERGDSRWTDRPHPLIALGVVGFGSALYAISALFGTHRIAQWTFAASFFSAKSGEAPSHTSSVTAVTLSLIALLSWVAWRFEVKAKVIDGRTQRESTPEEARTHLTQSLRTVMVLAAGLFAFALVDSLGQSAYSVLHEYGVSGVGRWIAAGFSSVAALATLVQRAAGLFAEKTSGRLRLPMQLLTAVAGFTLLLVMLVGVFTIAHSLTWDPSAFEKAQPVAGPLQYSLTTSDGGTGELRAAPDSQQLQRCARPLASGEASSDELTLCTPRKVMWPVFLSSLFLAWLFTYLFRKQYSFVNRSSLSAFYGIRLARAYLGASNAEREKPANQALTTLLRGDEMALSEFKPHERGGPLTIINVTVNETVGGRSQVQQRDRKGLGMAIGPAGVSVGARHHARWGSQADLVPEPEQHMIGDANSETSRAQFQVFYVEPRTKDGKPDGSNTIHPHWPSVGRWMAISGAAVSTGLGSRTSIGLSLLIGMLNFRLGYWWRSGMDPMKRPQWMRSGSELKVRSFLGVIGRSFPVQMHLIDEWLARFPGTSSADWYLSDGGHFENSGAYELIRRRLPWIIVCDNGADPQRSFDDLGNLVRKVRTDFGAHINFLQDADFGSSDKDKDLRRVVGTLGDIGFCGRLAEALEESSQGADSSRVRSTGENDQRLPKCYAALARVTYEDEFDGAEARWLVWLRPAVLGIEPFDVLNYQVANREFPQQSTGDQFFDEAQWESYRRLGEFMACHVFSAFLTSGTDKGGWIPFNPPEWKGGGCGSAALGRTPEQSRPVKDAKTSLDVREKTAQSHHVPSSDAHETAPDADGCKYVNERRRPRERDDDR